MATTFSGKLIGEDMRLAIVQARWNDFMGNKLLEGAMDTLIRHNVSRDSIDVVLVPGSFEIPMAARKLVQTNRYDAIICLGVVIRGATPHFDYIAGEVAKGIAQISLDSGVPVTFGVLTCDSIEQAIERAGSKSGNKGGEAALAAIEMVNLYREIDSGTAPR